MRSVLCLFKSSLFVSVIVLFTGCPTINPIEPVDANERIIADQIRSLRGTVRLDKSGLVVEVNLSNTGVRDEDLMAVSKLSKMQILSLSKTGISDKGLVHLKNHRMLRQIFLHRSKVTDSGVDVLKRAIPQCRVIY